MARISFVELVSVLKGHPDYLKRWELGTPADVALDIVFGERPSGVVPSSDDLTAIDGRDVILDRDPDGRVYGIEIH